MYRIRVEVGNIGGRWYTVQKKFWIFWLTQYGTFSTKEIAEYHIKELQSLNSKIYK